MKPYYDHAGIPTYHSDCREVLPCIVGTHQTVITDPVWPNCPALGVSDRPRCSRASRPAPGYLPDGVVAQCKGIRG